MTRETKTKKKVEAQTVEKTEYESEAQLVDEDVPGTRCDHCDQWFADSEPVQMHVLRKEPEVNLTITEPEQLQKIATVSHPQLDKQVAEGERITMEDTRRDFGDMVIEGEQGGKLPTKMEFTEFRSQNRPLGMYQPDDVIDAMGLLAAFSNSNYHRVSDDARDKLQLWTLCTAGEVQERWPYGFQIDIDVPISGKTVHFCDYCWDNL